MAYTVRLSAFEGPLDLLLHLINRAQVDIREIFISQITEQFIDAVSNAEDSYMDTVSEFLNMAALLLELKARSLLPVKPKMPEGEESPEELLFRSLEEYKRIKQSLEPLKRMEAEAARVFARLPGEVADGEVELLGVSCQLLAEALRGVLGRVSERAEERVSVIERETFTLEQGIFHIQRLLNSRTSVTFEELFEDAASRADVITLFLSLLELMRIGRVSVAQERPMDAIWISGKGRVGVGA